MFALMEDFDCVLNKVCLIRDFQNMATRNSILCYVIDVLPVSIYACVSQNLSVSCSWLTHNLYSKNELVSQIEVMYWGAFDDNTPFPCEKVFNFGIFARSMTEVTEVNSNVAWLVVLDNQ